MKVGIYLGQESAAATLVRKARRGRWQAEATASAPVDPAFWQGDAAAIRRVLARLAADLGPAARRADVPVSVALPDYLIREERLSFTDLPESIDELNRLVDWRVARDYRLEQGSFRASHQSAGGTDGQSELLVRIAPAALVATITAAARSSGLRVVTLEGVSSFLQGSGRADALTVRILQTDCEAIGLFTGPGLPLGHVRAQPLASTPPDIIARTLARLTQSNKVVTGRTSADLEVSADESLTVPVLAALAQQPSQLGPRLDPAALAAQVATQSAPERQTNFAMMRAARPRLAALALSVAGLAAFGLAGLAVSNYASLADRSERMGQHIRQATAADPATDTAPSRLAIGDLAARVDFYNQLVGDRRTDLGGVLSLLETALPDRTWLRRLNYDPATGDLSLSVVALEETDLAPALSRLEDTGQLTSVILDRQLQVRSGQTVLAQYDISGTLR